MKLFKLAAGITAARQLAKQHAPRVHEGIDKAADLASTKLGPQHHDRIESGRRMAKQAATGTDGGAPPAV